MGGCHLLNQERENYMAKQAISPDMRKAIISGRRLIEDVIKSDGNEAETRRRVERIFETITSYKLEHLSREHAVKGAGTTEHVDFAIQVEGGADARPVVMVELKRVGVDLQKKHLNQVCSYAINAGCEWVILTNGREWRIYHVEFGQPPITKLVDQWNLVKDDVHTLAKKFELISFKNIRRGGLKKLWEKTKVLAPDSILSALLSIECLRAARRNLRKKTDVLVDFDDIVDSLKRLLNESAAKTLEELNWKPPAKPKQSRTPNKENGAVMIPPPPTANED